MRLLNILLLVLHLELLSAISWLEAAPAGSTSSSTISSTGVRILALFSGTSKDLGLDHRLGRQVLKLAASKARRLNNELAAGDLLEVLVYSDEADCDSLGTIANRVAEQFYVRTSSDEQCLQLERLASSRLGSSGHQLVLAQNSSHASRPPSKSQADSCRDHQQASGRSDELEHYLAGERALGVTAGRATRQAAESDKRIDAILGPGCDYMVDLIARMASYWQVPMFTTTSVSGRFARKDVYSTLTRLSPSIDQLSSFVIKVLQLYKWRHLGIIFNSHQAESRLIHENLERAIEQSRYISARQAIESRSFEFRGFARPVVAASSGFNESKQAKLDGLCNDELWGVLNEVKRIARVVLLLLDEETSIRQVLLCAHSLEMNNGEYTFLALSLGLRSSRATERSASATAQTSQTGAAGLWSASQQADWFLANDDSNNAKARQMFESLMLLSVQLPIGDEYQYFVEQTLELAQQEYPEANFERSSVGAVAVALHDSLLMAVESIRRLRGGGFSRSQASDLRYHKSVKLHNRTLNFVDEDNGEDSRANESDWSDWSEEEEEEDESSSGVAALSRSGLVNPLWASDLGAEASSIGFLMREMRINERGDQELDYILSDMEPESGAMRPVAVYSRARGEVQFLPNTYVHWPARYNADTRQLSQNDEPPADEPECGFTGQAERCVDRQNLYAALILAAASLLLVAIIGSLTLHRYKQIRYQMQLDDFWWKISWAELEFVNLAGGCSALGSGRSQVSALLPRAGRTSRANSTATSVARQVLTLEGARGSLVGSLVSARSSAADHSALLEVQAGPLGSGLRRSAVPSISVAPDSLKRAAELDKHRQHSLEGSLAQTQLSAGAKSSKLLPLKLSGGGGGGDKTDGHHGMSNTANGSACLIRSEFSALVKVSSLALFRHELVIVKQLNASSLEVSRQLLIELKSIRELVHENLAKFVGICVEPERSAIVYEFCSRGSLQQLLLNETIAIDWNLKYSIIGDILNGLNFIHTSPFDYHGRLKSTNLVLDSRFTVKLTDFGLSNLYSQLELIENCDEDEADEAEEAEEGEEAHVGQQLEGEEQRFGHEQLQQRRMSSLTQTIYNMDSVSLRAERMATRLGPGRGRRGLARGPDARQLKNRGSARFFWTAPEHLRERRPHLAGSKRGDVYAFGIILFEIFTRREPYHYGTTAKPFWPAIKRDKRQQKQRQQQEMHPEGAPSELSGTMSDLLASRGAGSRAQARAHRPKRLSKVGPSLAECEQAAAAAARPGGGGGGNGGGQTARTVLEAQGQRQPVSVSVSSATPIDERQLGELAEEQEHDREQADETGSVLSKSSRVLGQPALAPAADKNQARAAAAAAAEDARIAASEILDQVRMGVKPEPIRPYMPNYLAQGMSPQLLDVMRACLSEAPSERPSVGQLRGRLRKVTKGATAKNYLDNLLQRLQSYAAQLEQAVDLKSADIVSEKMRTEELLYQLLPKFVADKLKRSEPIIPQVFDGVTIFFSDIVGFEKYASVMSPCELVDLLNSIYSSFESIISSFDVTKIEIILDQFMVAGGILLDDQADMMSPMCDTPASQQQQQQQGTAATLVRQESKDRAKPSKKKHRLAQLKSSTQSIQSEPEQPQSTADNETLQRQLLENHRSDHYKRSSAEQVGRMALCIRDLVKSFHFRQNLAADASNATQKCDPNNGPEQPQQSRTNFVATSFNIRIGIHSGKVCAGIVGLKRPKFCLIGDTVNVASRMHTNSKANRIQVSSSTRELLKNVPGFKLEPRGRIEIKGKGLMETFWLESSY